MKKIQALLLAITLIFAFCACGEKKGGDFSSDQLSSIIADAEFEKPDSYAYLLSVTINPKFDLYLNAQDDVIAINAVNDDAKSFKDDIDLSDPDLDDVVEKIVKAASAKGFIKGNEPTVTFELSDAKNQQIDTNDILEDAADAVNDAAKDLNLTIKVNIGIKTPSPAESSKPEQNSKPASANTSSQASNSSDVSTSSKAYTSSKASTSNKVTETSKPEDESQEPHIHLYTPANCTKPATCACGATDGKALGHMWENATCKAPKTCHICKKTEGSVGEHDYKDGKCTVCGASNYLNPKTSLKLTEEYVAQKYYVYNETSVYAPGVAFYNDGGFGEGVYCLMLDAMFISEPDADIKNRTPITYNGKKYYRYGAGQSPAYVELTDTEIIITQSSDTVKLVLMADGDLKVTSSTINTYPVGTILSINWNYLK